METNSAPFTTVAIEKKQSAKRFFDNLKTNKNVHTTIFFVLFFIYEIVYCVVAYKYGNQWCQEYSYALLVAFPIGTVIAFGFLLYFLLYLKTKREKDYFLKFYGFMPLICYAPIFYLTVCLVAMEAIPGSELVWMINILLLLGICNINAFLSIYLTQKKNRETVLYGALAFWFAFTGLGGGGLNAFGYPFVTSAWETNQHPLMSVYKLFTSNYSHMPLLVLAIIIFKEKLTKLNLVNVIWFIFFWAICYGWGSLELFLFPTNNGQTVFHNPGMYINWGLMGEDDKIFRFFTIAGIGTAVAFGVSLVNELCFFPVNERFYKKRFNIFDTYWKQEQLVKAPKK